jgi:hypothetical protein
MDREKKRLKDINNILRFYNEPDIPDLLINKIRRKFPSLKNCEYLHTEQLGIGDLIQMVDLNITHLSIKGVCVKINYSENKTIESILLFNSNIQIFWKINPTKYYVFKAKTKIEEEDEYINNSIKDVYKNINKNIKNSKNIKNK